MASSSPPCPPYVYDPLPTPSHTRIVELLPAVQQTAPLYCRLVTLNLDDDAPPRYEALSYTWGQPVFSERLFIRGPNDDSDIRVLQITPSLASALRRLRHGDAPVRRVWADAVCINQGDTAEKGRQIPLMSTIYRGASRVVAWLDPCVDGEPEVRARRLNALMRPCSIRRHALQPGTLSKAAGLLEQHFAMPWFSRRWIIQEVVGHPDVELLCGEEEMGWLPLMLMVTEVFRDVKVPPAVVTSVLMMYDLWRMWVMGEPRSGQCRLMKLLGRFGHFGCADGRDRIYALAGLAEDGHGDDALVPISMDYSVSAEQLYTELAEELVKVGYLSWVLQQACARRCTNEGLPSWAPDWRVPPTTKTFWEETAGIRKWSAYVREYVLNIHAFAAELCCLRTWKPHAGKLEAFRYGDMEGMTKRPPWEEWPAFGDGQTGEDHANFDNYVHLDVSPLEVEWKNSKDYPRGAGAPALRTWILETANRIREMDLEGKDESVLWRNFDPKFWRTRGALQQLLVEGCHRQHGRDGQVLDADVKELDEYISGGDLTANVEKLIRDVDTMMSGRCIFLCRIRSSLSASFPAAPPSTVMGIGPSETEVGDRVMSFQSPFPPFELLGCQLWDLERICNHTYVVRGQLAQTDDDFPSTQAQISGSLPKFTGFRLVGDCFLLRDRLRSYPEFIPEDSVDSGYRPSRLRWLCTTDWHVEATGLFIC